RDLWWHRDTSAICVVPSEIPRYARDELAHAGQKLRWLARLRGLLERERVLQERAFAPGAGEEGDADGESGDGAGGDGDVRVAGDRGVAGVAAGVVVAVDEIR